MNIAFRRGVLDAAPLYLSAMPFGILFGVLAVDVGLGLIAGQAFSAVFFAGSAQFASADLFGQGAGLGLIFLITFLLNIRHLLYALDLAKRCPHWPRSARLVWGFLLTDESYAVTARRLDKNGTEPLPLSYFAGASLGMWTAWNIATLIGILIGAKLTNIGEWGLEIAIYAAYIGIFVPLIRSWPKALAALVAASVAIYLHDLPNQAGFLIALFAGLSIGLTADLYFTKKESLYD